MAKRTVGGAAVTILPRDPNVPIRIYFNWQELDFGQVAHEFYHVVMAFFARAGRAHCPAKYLSSEESFAWHLGKLVRHFSEDVGWKARGK